MLLNRRERLQNLLRNNKYAIDRSVTSNLEDMSNRNRYENRGESSRYDNMQRENRGEVETKEDVKASSSTKIQNLNNTNRSVAESPSFNNSRQKINN